MGKEVKIGLAFILSLLIVFGVVLGKRLMAPSQEQASASAEKPDDRTAGKGRQEATKQGTESGFPAPDEPTVVTAKTVSAKSPKGSAAQWSVVSGQPGSGRSGGAAEAPLPSYMPKPTPSSADYYGRYGSSAQESTPEKPWRQDGADTAPSVETAPIADPFNGRATQTPNTAEPLDPPTGELKVLSPPTRPADGAGGEYGQHALPANDRAPGSFATRQDSSSLQQSPPYNRTEPLRPPEPVAKYSPVGRSGSIYETAAAGAQLAAKGLHGNDGSYNVQPNDNYWVISRRLYGTGAYFRALAEHNRNKVPQEDQLTVGQSISAPGVTELEELYPELCPKPSRREIVKQRATSVGRLSSYRGGRTYTVQQGDTLFDIARYELGKASRWSEIYELNRDVIGEDYDYLPTGLQLALPSDAPAENVTRRPGSGQYYR